MGHYAGLDRSEAVIDEDIVISGGSIIEKTIGWNGSRAIALIKDEAVLTSGCV